MVGENEQMRKLIYVSDCKVHDKLKRQYDVFITFVSGENDDVVPDGSYYTLAEFTKYIREVKPYGVGFAFESQDELEYVINLIYDFIGSINLAAKHNKVFDFSPLEKCTELVAIQMYWNTKQERLWDIRKNTKLKSFEIMDYYKVSDLSAFRGSTVEHLSFYGCNGCSSFVSKMHVADFSFLLDMPKLTELSFDIIKDEPSEYYLRILSKLQGLKTFYTPDSFFTFQQFAWLKAKMPNVEKGLDCVLQVSDWYCIIGRRTPKTLDDPAKIERYQKRYDTLVEKYKTRENPPSDDEKD